MKISELKRYKTQGVPAGVFAAGGQLFMLPSGSTSLYSIEPKTSQSTEVFEAGATRPAGLAEYDGEVYFLDKATNCIVKSPIGTYAPKQVLDLNALDVSKTHPALHSDSAEVTDVAARGKALFITVSAGYSSGVYEIDMDKGEVNRFFFAFGPEPTGIAQDAKTKCLFVTDASAGYIAEFTPEGVRMGEPVKLPTRAPYGLAIDERGHFFVGAQDTAEVIEFTVQEDEK